MLSHGYTVETEYADPLIYIAEKGANAFSVSTQRGKWMVDTFPIRAFASLYISRSIEKPNKKVKYLPQWMPGAEFKRLAASWKKLVLDELDIPFEFVKQKLVILSSPCLFPASWHTHHNAYRLVDQLGGQ